MNTAVLESESNQNLSPFKRWVAKIHTNNRYQMEIEIYAFYNF